MRYGLFQINRNLVSRIGFLVLLIITGGFSFSGIAGESGKAVFQQTCVACHTIGEGRLVGPDLKGISQRRSKAWIVQFVKESQKMIKNGDPEAVAVFQDYNKLIMPDQNLTSGQIEDVIQFIKEVSGTTGLESKAKISHSSDTAGSKNISKEDIAKGQKLFQGTLRLKSKGAACISCHSVRHDSVVSGGALAKELTTSVSTMGSAGVKAMISNPPFPVMKAAYKDAVVQSDEADALVAFLTHVDQIHETQQPVSYGIKLALSGLTGFALLLGLFSLIWIRRKVKTVNTSVFNRQVKSESDPHYFKRYDHHHND